ncbi:MAG: acetyl-CoA carboxylase carboxyl transferase subunit beta, partial [Legionellales bacterium]|nr:acetyl-CoA carboxylase carboxyl transferase subunit beta [Legionellales bacterium]
MSWFGKLIPQKIRTVSSKKSDMPEGLWSNCVSCKSIQYRTEFERNLFVCSKCGFHSRINARKRLQIILDEGSYSEIINDIENRDPLKFKDSKKYKDRVLIAQKNTNEKDALVVLKGQINQLPVVAAAFEFGFMGGSMGSSVGEMFVRGVKAAIANSCPFIVFTASGGARMQEGVVSLFQMAKTSAILQKLSKSKLPYISVLTDPT